MTKAQLIAKLQEIIEQLEKLRQTSSLMSLDNKTAAIVESRLLDAQGNIIDLEALVEDSK